MERLLEIIEDGDTKNLEAERDALDYWFQADRFGRKAPTGPTPVALCAPSVGPVEKHKSIKEQHNWFRAYLQQKTVRTMGSTADYD